MGEQVLDRLVGGPGLAGQVGDHRRGQLLRLVRSLSAARCSSAFTRRWPAAAACSASDSLWASGLWKGSCSLRRICSCIAIRIHRMAARRAAPSSIAEFPEGINAGRGAAVGAAGTRDQLGYR